MSYKIKNEKLSSALWFIAAFLLLFTATYYSAIRGMHFNIMCTTALGIVGMLFFFVAQTVRTVVTINDDNITIKHLFSNKIIPFSNISDVKIERYKRRHKNAYIEQRMRMKLFLANGKKIVLNDTAMDTNGALDLLVRSSRVLPDEKVVLYKVFQAISEKIF
ncbi:MAG: hypothetical protein K6G33_06720 [Ruminococcus sp.]|uniref:hypothetical protein n=1 Tax=Ruminococcus sp. TaxID=41978 RepID=UPI0025E4A288|nr:hypothetical protein [Ruminococcus sp.]MCR5600412.1 hypothetical protein [Ruminococcus sp.]